MGNSDLADVQSLWHGQRSHPEQAVSPAAWAVPENGFRVGAEKHVTPCLSAMCSLSCLHGQTRIRGAECTAWHCSDGRCCL